MVSPTKANFEWLISQAYMCYVCNSLGTTLHQERLTLMKAPTRKKLKVSFFWNQVTYSSVHKHTHTTNTSHTEQFKGFDTFTLSPAKRSATKWRHHVTGWPWSPAWEQERNIWCSSLRLDYSKSSWFWHTHKCKLCRSINSFKYLSHPTVSSGS